MYDYLIVGSGLFGSVVAHELTEKGYKVLVIEKRNHVGGNIYTEKEENINIHVYGAHIFHTSNKEVWDYINKFAKFNNFINSPLANYHGEMYHLPFNMNTFVEIFPDVKTKKDAIRHIEEEKKLYGVSEPKNLEEQAINLVGKTIYRKLIKEYTEKQWGRDCKELPSFIIKRIPVRFEFNNDYFNDKYQGIPIGGYTNIINKLLKGSDVLLNADFFEKKNEYEKMAKRIIYTGAIDEYFDYKFGKLEYRSLIFIKKVLDIEDYQHNAVINYTSHDQKYTRIIEHKHFENDKSDKTIIFEEYPVEYIEGMEKYYPVNNDKNNDIYNRYFEESKKTPNVLFGGRLGMYKYFDMDDTIESAINLVKTIV